MGDIYFLILLSIFSKFSTRYINFHEEEAEILVLITHSFNSFPIHR